MNPTKSPAVELVCKRYCSYYKPDQKEDNACQGLKALQNFIEHNPRGADLFRTEQDATFTDQYHHLLNHSLCQHCDFLIDGCDFKDPKKQGQTLPCGGYLAADLLLQRSSILENQLMELLFGKEAYVSLGPNCVLRHLERPYLYDPKNDELYELDQEGFAFLRKCDGMHPVSELAVEKDFLETCLREKLLVIGFSATRRHFNLRPSPVPSLRYVELQLTDRCNLKCKHCYLGEPRKADLPVSQVLSVLDEFEQMQGLRVLFSGGEPLLYPHLEALNEALPRYGFRKVLLTNGTLITEDSYPNWCHFDEIQFSLDGLKTGHETLRGAGTFEATTRGIEVAQKKGISISIATMIHRYNLKEFKALAQWVEKRQVPEWNIDVPCSAGRLVEHRQFLVKPEEGSLLLKYATGGSYHGTDESFACGYHLCTITSEGDVLKCGFFKENPLGSLQEGLEACWKRNVPVPLTRLECGPCPHLADCKGGCRFRAGTPLGKDPVMCALYGWQKNKCP